MTTLSTAKPKVNDPSDLADHPRWVAWCEGETEAREMNGDQDEDSLRPKLARPSENPHGSINLGNAGKSQATLGTT